MRPLIALASLTLFATAAQAGGGHERHKDMASLDADGDGAITREEAKSHPRLVEKFDAVDANKDGKLEKTELDAQREAHRAEWKARGEERWKSADTDGNGTLSRVEAEASMPWMSGSFEKLDGNADGQLTREEMRAGREHGHEGMREAAADRFKGADANGDGAIDLAEAQTGMPKLAEKFTTVDANNDGKVTPDELRSLRHR
jgi:Ca2+-binding EF-hand superfamily protein